MAHHVQFIYGVYTFGTLCTCGNVRNKRCICTYACVFVYRETDRMQL